MKTRRYIAAVLVVWGAMAVASLAQGPLTNFVNMRLSASSGALAVQVASSCGTMGPLTAVGNLRLSSGASGALNVCLASSGTFANRPASPGTGALYIFTDSNTAVWGAAIAAGGANTVLGFYNGSAWTVVAK